MMKSVLLQMAMFPTDKGESKSQYVSEIIKLIRDSGVKYQLTPMATIIECDNMRVALNLVADCYECLESLGCQRVYSTLTFDIRDGYENRMEKKISSIEEKIGEVFK